jgi:hypothetical protein
MVKWFFLFFGLSFFRHSFGQYAILKDKDGFVNVREKGDVRSNIKDTLHNDKIIFFWDKPQGEWVSIDFLKNGKPRSGYVHRSRVQFIESFIKFNHKQKSDSLLEMKLDSITISMAAGKFQKIKRSLKFGDNSSFLISIDGKHVWGADGNTPKKEYRSFVIKSGNQTSAVEIQYWHDLFEPSFDFTDAYLDKGSGTIYLLASNSDGAGGYAVIWVIKNNQIINRQIDIPF